VDLCYELGSGIIQLGLPPSGRVTVILNIVIVACTTRERPHYALTKSPPDQRQYEKKCLS
jgi:hypothetical protein